MKNMEIETYYNLENIEIEKNPYYEYFKDFRIYSENDHTYTYTLVQDFDECKEIFKKMEEKLNNTKYIIQLFYQNFQNLNSYNNEKYYKGKEKEDLVSFEDIVDAINKEEDDTTSVDLEIVHENVNNIPNDSALSLDIEIVHDNDNTITIDEDKISVVDPEYDSYYDFYCYLLEKYLRKDYFDEFLCFYHIPTEYYRIKIFLFKIYKLYEKIREKMHIEVESDPNINASTSTEHWITCKKILENFESENIPDTLKYIKKTLRNAMNKQENKRISFLKWQNERMLKVNPQLLEELGQKFREKNIQETKIQQAQEDLSRLPYIKFEEESQRYEQAINLEAIIYKSKVEKLKLER